jgi:asparagine synthase (glutamine-hydrolysing)
MTAIFGYIVLGGTPVPERCRRFFEEPGTAAARAPLVERMDSGIVAVAGNPTLPGSDGRSLPARLLAAYRESGPGVLERLRGPFALVIADLARQRVLLAIDRMGIERLAWGRSGAQVAFGTSAAQVAALLSDDPQVDRQALFDYTLSHMVPAPATAFTGVDKLLPATAVEIDGASVREIRYWQPDFRRNGSPPVEVPQGRPPPRAPYGDRSPTGRAPHRCVPERRARQLDGYRPFE